ncbi:HBR010Cp [Eremothecium sinecaudum]|uniref:HBR010Cp n=1 Tax=Eremothecium sinecaudum TaxID=45286 RepID=A0A109UWL2_9SACH|nr:HBR010Cp [Eremothecium sinecaudum]AMD18911.1 HBR010Cp [Eremothecium sinecaudum]
MSFKLSACEIVTKTLQCRGSRIRKFSSDAAGNPATEETGNELLVERRGEFNNQLLSIIKSLRTVPEELVGKMDGEPNGEIKEKEQQLDEKLTAFLRNYSNHTSSTKQDGKNLIFDDKIRKSSSQKSFPYLVSSGVGKPYSKQELFVRQLKHASSTAKLGANIKNVYFPHNDIFHPPSVEDVSVKKLMAAGVHLGQSTSLWRPSTQPFIYGEYKDIHLIDLTKTLSCLKRAAHVIEGVAENGGIILFLGTREGQKRVIQKAAERLNGYYVSSRWIPGTLTNPTEISSIWERHEVDYYGNPTGRKLTDEESVSIVKPDLLVVLNPTENRIALLEAMKTRVPTIGIIDTDSEPSMVTYPIPGNDDSLRSVSLLVSVLAKAGQKGLKNRLSKTVDLLQ